MKTAVSVPNDLFAKADALAKASGRSRSEIYSTALREYVARHSPEELTDAVNRAVEQLGGDVALDQFTRSASRLALNEGEW